MLRTATPTFGACRLVEELSWDKLHIGSFSTVPGIWRDTYSLMQANKALLWLSTSTSHIEDTIQQSPTMISNAIACLLQERISMKPTTRPASVQIVIATCLSWIDFALLMAGPNKELSSIASSLHAMLPTQRLDFPHEDGSRVDLDLYSVLNNVVRVESPSKVEVSKICASGIPTVLMNRMSEWPALMRWSTFDYLLEKAGYRLVPVEIGKHYMAEAWTQKVCTLASFVENDISSVGSAKKREHRKGYLAQDEFFHRVPELFEDIKVPEPCREGFEKKAVAVNLWLGPAGKTSSWQCHLMMS